MDYGQVVNSNCSRWSRYVCDTNADDDKCDDDDDDGYQLPGGHRAAHLASTADWLSKQEAALKYMR